MPRKDQNDLSYFLFHNLFKNRTVFGLFL